ncbi:MAG TPA: polyketide cyclase, partial [Xylella fastidiosa subsp. pauca]
HKNVVDKDKVVHVATVSADGTLKVAISAGAPVKYVHTKPRRAASASYTGHMAGLDAARNALRAWAVTSGYEVIDRPYESWKGGVDKAFTQEGSYDLYWAVK